MLAARDRELARLMVLSQAGDQEAYARVLRGCVEIVDRLQATGCPPALSTNDCLQIIHAARHTFDPRRSFVRWVETIALRHRRSP